MSEQTARKVLRDLSAALDEYWNGNRTDVQIKKICAHQIEACAALSQPAAAGDTLICLGCGHIGEAPTGDKVISCCPEREPVTIKDLFNKWVDLDTAQPAAADPGAHILRDDTPTDPEAEAPADTQADAGAVGDRKTADLISYLEELGYSAPLNSTDIAIILPALRSTLRTAAPSPSSAERDLWQPMETAPKIEGKKSWDQPHFMAYFGKTLCEGYFDPDEHAKKPKPFWNTSALRISDARANQPVAWQPLPQPPAFNRCSGAD